MSAVAEKDIGVKDLKFAGRMDRVEIEDLDERDHSTSKFNNAFNSSFTYTASYPPSLVGALINMYTVEGDVVLDPFSGRGTSALQSLQMRRKGIANDLSPVAYTYCHAVVKPMDLSRLDDVFDILEEKIKDIPINPYDWEELLQLYTFDTLRDILALRELLNDDDFLDTRTRMFLKAYLISILIGSGKECLLDLGLWANISCSLTAILGLMHDSQSRKKRGEDVKVVYRSDDDVLEKLRDKILNCTKSGVPDEDGEVYKHDGCRLSEVIDDDVDFVVTSPPYADVIKYGIANFLHFWFLGERYDKYDDLTEEKGSCSPDYDEFFDFMKRQMEDMYKVTSDDAYMAYVIGGSQTDKDLGQLHLPRKLALYSRDVGFVPEKIFIEEYQGGVASASSGDKKIHRDAIVVMKKGDPEQYMDWETAYQTGIESNVSVIDQFDKI